MPKELHEITKFTTGTITVPDEKDIPEDAASYSLNIDSVTEGGKLKGVPADFYLQNTGTFADTGGNYATVDAQVMAMINRDGYRDIVYFEDDTTKIHNIIDPYRTGAKTGTGIAAVDSNPDTLTDSANGFLTAGFKSGQLIHVTGFTGTSANNTTYKVDSVAAGTITLISDDSVTGDTAGESVTVTTFEQNDMGAITSSEGQVTMQVHNKEVHVGAGKGSSDAPKWVGYVDHSQFGARVPIEMQMENAELERPGSFPAIYKVIKIGSDVFGIQYGGTRIYRFSETAFVSASYTEFVSTQGISIVGATGPDFWVYDDSTAFGTMYKIDVSEWGTENEVSQENNIGGWGGVGTALDSGFDISDMHDDDSVGSKIWFFAYKSGNIASTADANWLYNVDVPTANGIITPDKRTPKLAAGSADGDWVSTGPTAVLYKQCLVAGGDGVTGVGVMIHLTFSGAVIVSSGGGTTQAFANGLCMFSVGDTYPDKTPIEITPSGTDDHQLHEIINGGNTYDYGGTSYWGGFYQDLGNLFVAIRTSATSTSIKVFNDVVYADVTTSPSIHFSAATLLEISSDDVDPIEANGLCMTYDTGDDVIYMCENNGTGGYLDINFTPANVFTDIDYLERSNIRVSFTDVADGEFQDDDTYFWRFAYMYDGYQETPLSDYVTYTPADDKHVQLTIDLYNVSDLSKRVSHLMVYRAENSTAAGKTTPDSFYRLVKKIKLDAFRFALISDGWGVDASGTTAADFRSHVLLDELNTIGASYEARTLMPETLETSMVNYALSTQINSMHIVGKCYKTEIPDAMNYLFKSKVNSFDQFDWTTDFIRLPTVPTALSSFNGRIYAFDENNTYRINPQGFYIEDTFEGAGCFGPDSFVVTEYGMCYCDKNNIYLHDGKSPKPIASPILTGDSNYSWHNIVQTKEPMVMFDAKRKSFIIFFRSTNSYSGYFFAWSYNLIYNRWDLLSYGASEPKGILHGKNGELFVAQSNGYLAHFMGGSSVDTWEWQSKYMTMGEDTVNKKFYDINVVNGGVAPNVLYGIGSATPSQDPTSESGSSNYKGKVQSAHSKSKTLQIKLVQAGGSSHTVDSVGVLYRRLPKTSGNI